MSKHKYRLVKTKFWTDSYVLDKLNPVDKLLYLYLITNPYTDISGVYELPLQVMAVETGIDRENIERVILPRFEKDGKIMYQDGWVAIKNFKKHQSLNPSVQKGIEDGLSKAPHKLRVFVESATGSDRLSQAPTESEVSKSKSKSKSKDKYILPVQSTGAQVNNLILAFKDINPSYERLYARKPQRCAAERLIQRYGLERLEKVIGFIASKRGDRFLPTITTPIMLEEKWAALENYAARVRNETVKNKIVKI